MVLVSGLAALRAPTTPALDGADGVGSGGVEGTFAPGFCAGMCNNVVLLFEPDSRMALATSVLATFASIVMVLLVPADGGVCEGACECACEGAVLALFALVGFCASTAGDSAMVERSGSWEGCFLDVPTLEGVTRTSGSTGNFSGNLAGGGGLDGSDGGASSDTSHRSSPSNAGGRSLGGRGIATLNGVSEVRLRDGSRTPQSGQVEPP